MDSLLILHIIDQLSNNFSSELKISGLKKLKTLTVGKLAQLDNLVGMDALLELCVTNVFGHELKEFDLSSITKRFKNLQNCDIIVDTVNGLSQPEEYAKIVQDIFQNSATRVKIVTFVFDRLDSFIYLIKEPFQRCVVKKEGSYDSDLDSDVSKSDDE